MTNIENTQAQMRKGILEFCILEILHKQEAYPSEILAQLKDSQMIVVEGTLYPLLTRLKNAELLSYHWVESTGGPPRKYYKTTALGDFSLLELRKTWNELKLTIETLITK